MGDKETLTSEIFKPRQKNLVRVMWQSSPNFLAPGTGFFEDSFSRDVGGRSFGMIQVHCIILYLFIVYFISVFITSAPPQIIRH